MMKIIKSIFLIFFNENLIFLRRNGSNSDFILQTQKEKNLPKKIEKEKKFSEMGYDNISRGKSR